MLFGAVDTAPARAADPVPECTPGISAASYADPTTRYSHGALGDDAEWGTLRLVLTPGAFCKARPTRVDLRLPDSLVFEDTAPRLADLDGDDENEVITVESHKDQGARLAVWGVADGTPTRLTATPFIGTRFRWLAPLGAADLDGDGQTELAYVDRPHLARTLRVWRYADRRLTEIASLPNVTNHRFGERRISGGIRTCDGTPEIILVDAGWQRVLAVTLSRGKLNTRDLGPFRNDGSLTRALNCEQP